MTETRNYNFGWVFMLLAWAILTFSLGVVWWAAALLVLLANFEVNFTTTSRYRWR